MQNLPFKKDFKFAELSTKTSFSFTLETVLKMAKQGNKLRKRRIYIRKSN